MLFFYITFIEHYMEKNGISCLGRFIELLTDKITAYVNFMRTQLVKNMGDWQSRP